MAYNPVGICTSITSSTSTAQSTVFSHQTPYLRVVAVSADAHIAQIQSQHLQIIM